jgi:hypothetical protein
MRKDWLPAEHGYSPIISVTVMMGTTAVRIIHLEPLIPGFPVSARYRTCFKAWITLVPADWAWDLSGTTAAWTNRTTITAMMRFDMRRDVMPSRRWSQQHFPRPLSSAGCLKLGLPLVAAPLRCVHTWFSSAYTWMSTRGCSRALAGRPYGHQHLSHRPLGQALERLGQLIERENLIHLGTGAGPRE